MHKLSLQLLLGLDKFFYQMRSRRLRHADRFAQSVVILLRRFPDPCFEKLVRMNLD